MKYGFNNKSKNIDLQSVIILILFVLLLVTINVFFSLSLCTQ